MQKKLARADTKFMSFFKTNFIPLCKGTKTPDYDKSFGHKVF